MHDAPSPASARLLILLRDADWLTSPRIRAWGLIFLGFAALGSLIWVLLSAGMIDRAGKPIGTDFASFYAASRLILDGDPGGAWDIDTHHAAQVAIFGRDPGYYAFFYPPPYALLIAPLALLPYGWALAAWLAATGAAMVAVLRRWAGSIAPVWAPAALPAIWLTIGHGQNAALTTAILGLGGLLADRMPILSGFVLGLLVIKPQLALVLPVALALSGRWETFVGAAAGATLVCLASIVWLGVDPWFGFIGAGDMVRATLEDGLVGMAKMQSTFAGLRLLGAPLALAYVVQTLVALAALGLVGRIAWRQPDGRTLFAVTAAATPLISPFLLDYDLLVLAIPCAWLLAAGARGGFRPWEKIMLLAVAVLPLIGRPLGMGLSLPIAPVVLMGFLAVVAGRARSRGLWAP